MTYVICITSNACLLSYSWTPRTEIAIAWHTPSCRQTGLLLWTLSNCTYLRAPTRTQKRKNIEFVVSYLFSWHCEIAWNDIQSMCLITRCQAFDGLIEDKAGHAYNAYIDAEGQITTTVEALLSHTPPSHEKCSMGYEWLWENRERSHARLTGIPLPNAMKGIT